MLTETEIEILTSAYSPYKGKIYFNILKKLNPTSKATFCFCESDYRQWYRAARELFTKNDNDQNQNQ